MILLVNDALSNGMEQVKPFYKKEWFSFSEQFYY